MHLPQQLHMPFTTLDGLIEWNSLKSAVLYFIASVLSHGRKPMYIKTNEGGVKRKQARSGMAPQT